MMIFKLALLQEKKKYGDRKYGPDEFDCSGLIWYIYNTLFDIDINSLGMGKSATTKEMTSNIGILSLVNEHDDISLKKIFISDMEIGDLVFFHSQSMNDNEPSPFNYYPGHVGLYLGDNKFIHSSQSKGQVIINSFNDNNEWYQIFVGSKDIVSHIKRYNLYKGD